VGDAGHEVVQNSERILAVLAGGVDVASITSARGLLRLDLIRGFETS
jgi:hypothetical protein